MSRGAERTVRQLATRAALAALITATAYACSAGGGGEGFRPMAVIDAAGASMGSVAFPVSCEDDAAGQMRLGLALLHNMTYAEAERTFARAAELDPGCGIARWGMAMTYLHPLWPDVPTEEQLERGWQLLQDARERGLGTPREESYVSALEAYYRDAPEHDEPSRLAAYAQGWAAVRTAYPSDPEAALFAALSLLAAPPAGAPLDRQREAGAIAEGVLQDIPDHPGAHHYVIHAFDLPSLAERALPVAHSYGQVAPENSHALHMTSHIFTRRGLWEESIDYNRRAADVALDEPIGGRTSHHHLHAIDYLVYAHLQRGDDERAQEVLDHLMALDGPVVNHAASAYAFAAVPARIALERKSWSDAAAIEARRPSTIPWDAYPHLEAIPVFARALGAARTGALGSAGRAAARLAELAPRAAELPDAYDWGTQVRIQELGARAWIAYAQGRADEAVRLMTEAADLEATTQKNPVTPGEVLPASELLGDMLLEIDRPRDALEAYASALARSPNRFNSLFGAGRAAELAGAATEAASYYRRLLEVGGSSSTRIETLEAARASVAAQVP
jgi:tetratricopeptide (TPR) repeat protein